MTFTAPSVCVVLRPVCLSDLEGGSKVIISMQLQQMLNCTHASLHL